jgi:hypothetical protein
VCRSGITNNKRLDTIIMAKKDNILRYKGEEYNLEDWLTIKQLAKELGYATKDRDGTQRISMWVIRGKIGNISIPELNNLVLVNRNTLPASH